jgi:serine/threonine protein kinase
MPHETQVETDGRKPTILQLTWDDVEVFQKLGSGAFASVYRVERCVPSSLRQKEDVDDDYHDDDNDSMTEATFLGDSFTSLTTVDHPPDLGFVIKCLDISSLFRKNEAILAAGSLVQEATILASLPRHPNIISLIGISSNLLSQDSMNGFLLFERVADTLDNVLKESLASKKPERRRLMALIDSSVREQVKCSQQQWRIRHFARGIAKAMKFLHENDVIHRDLKPSNVGLDHSGRVILLDFGCSRRISPQQDDRKLTLNVGTTRYMAPEVEKSSSGGYGFPADVYSFSILLWQILTLYKPFGDVESKEGLRKAKQLEQERPSLLDVASPNLRSLLKIGWSPSPEKRPTFRHIVRVLSMESSTSASSSPDRKRTCAKELDLYFL